MNSPAKLFWVALAQGVLTGLVLRGVICLSFVGGTLESHLLFAIQPERP